ncbi:MAG: hypothetical protein ACOC6G_02835 [Thermoproteota archaeon]
MSTFFPWSITGGQHWFLPFSISLLPVWRVAFLPETLPLLTINVAVRSAAISGLVALYLYHYSDKRVSATGILLISTGLSFTSFIIFIQLSWSLYLGAYLVLAAGLLKLISFVLNNIELEIIIED